MNATISPQPRHRRNHLCVIIVDVRNATPDIIDQLGALWLSRSSLISRVETMSPSAAGSGMFRLSSLDTTDALRTAIMRDLQTVGIKDVR
jgi:hypothetical protein